jgi:hypothetical protein
MTYLCPSCGDLLLSEAMDCPTCGFALDQTDREAHELTWIIDIRFDYSSSKSKYYPKAVGLLERADTYATEGKERDAHHHARYQADNIEPAVELWDIVKGWTSSTLQIDGREATKKDLSYHGLGCFRKYLEADEGRRYCFGQNWQALNFVGCKRLDMSAFDRGDISADLLYFRGRYRVEYVELTAIESADYYPLVSIELVGAEALSEDEAAVAEFLAFADAWQQGEIEVQDEFVLA